jgi:hypothetical protein
MRVDAARAAMARAMGARARAQAVTHSNLLTAAGTRDGQTRGRGRAYAASDATTNGKAWRAARARTWAMASNAVDAAREGAARARAANATRRARDATDRALGKRASEFLWTMSSMNPVVVKRAVEQRTVSAISRHWRSLEAAGAAAGGAATWRAARAWKRDVMGVPCDNAMFDVAFGDPSMLGGSMLLAGVGAFALRQRWRLDVDYAVTLAMRRLETHSGVRELLGGPVTLGNSRVVVTSGGGLALFKRTTSRMFGATTLPVSVDSKWAHVAFELRGTRKRGTVSLAARKWGGMYTIPLLALEVQSRDGEAYRMFLEGGAKDYDASVLPSLREPLEASTNNDEYKRAKAAADAHDVEHTAFVAARLREAKTPKPLDEGGRYARARTRHRRSFKRAALCAQICGTRQSAGETNANVGTCRRCNNYYLYKESTNQQLLLFRERFAFKHDARDFGVAMNTLDERLKRRKISLWPDVPDDD